MYHRTHIHDFAAFATVVAAGVAGSLNAVHQLVKEQCISSYSAPSIDVQKENIFKMIQDALDDVTDIDRERFRKNDFNTLNDPNRYEDSFAYYNQL